MASYTLDAPPPAGELVQINRLGRKGHGLIGRVVELDPDPNMAWVAFHTDKRKLPSLKEYRNPTTCPRKLFPLSNLLPYEQA